MAGAELPVLGLLVAPRPPSGVRALLHSLTTFCDPRVPVAGTGTVTAWLATSLDAPGVDRALAGAEPVAAWAVDGGDLGRGLADERFAILVSADRDLASRDARVLLSPGAGLDAARYLPMAPFVRARWRARSHLPDHLVVSVGDGTSSVPGDLLPTAFALASVVIAQGPRLIEAMAWGAPCVTDAASAAAAGAEDGVDVLVAQPGAFEDSASRLAGDDAMAAQLSWCGRRLVEVRHDVHRAASEVATRLGLSPQDVVAPNRGQQVLDELWTAPRSHIRTRLNDALVALSE